MSAAGSVRVMGESMATFWRAVLVGGVGGGFVGGGDARGGVAGEGDRAAGRLVSGKGDGVGGRRHRC